MVQNFNITFGFSRDVDGVRLGLVCFFIKEGELDLNHVFELQRLTCHRTVNSLVWLIDLKQKTVSLWHRFALQQSQMFTFDFEACGVREGIQKDGKAGPLEVEGPSEPCLGKIDFSAFSNFSRLDCFSASAI